jgi:hypothetical protein
MRRCGVSSDVERREDPRGLVDYQREMSFSWQELAMRSGQPFAQVMAMADRHDPILPAVPQVNVCRDLLQAKAPRSGQYEELIHVTSRTLAK